MQEKDSAEVLSLFFQAQTSVMIEHCKLNILMQIRSISESHSDLSSHPEQNLAKVPSTKGQV